MEPYQFSIPATSFAVVGSAPDPAQPGRVREFLNRFRSNRYVKVIAYGYALYQAYDKGVEIPLPNRPRGPDLNSGDEDDDILGFIKDVFPGFAGTPEDLDRVREWVRRTEDLAVPGNEDAIITWMGQQWLVDP